MKSLMLILSVVAVVMSAADAYSSKSRSSWADIESKIRLAELYKEIEDLEVLEKASGGSSVSTDVQKRISNFFTRLDVVTPGQTAFSPDGKITREDFAWILQYVVYPVQTGITDTQKAYVNLTVAGMAQYNFENIAGSQADFIANIENKLPTDTGTFPDFANKVFSVFFSAVDGNDDGKMSADEYEKVYDALFTPAGATSYSQQSFDVLTKGQFGKNKFFHACDYYAYGTGYFNGDASSKYFWGTY